MKDHVRFSMGFPLPSKDSQRISERILISISFLDQSESCNVAMAGLFPGVLIILVQEYGMLVQLNNLKHKACVMGKANAVLRSKTCAY